MFAYCQNNSVNYSDYTGHRIVGFGLQVEVQVGGVDIGFEIVIYFDPEVCDGDDFVIVFYNYSGTELTLTEVEDLLKVIDYGLLTALVTERDEIELDAILGMARMLLENAGISGGAFVIDGNEKFKDPTNYSGPFQTVSFSGRLKNCVGTAFYSYSDSCTTVGAKVGVTTSRFAFTPHLSQHFIDWLPFSCTYSQRNYSEPIVLYRG